MVEIALPMAVCRSPTAERGAAQLEQEAGEMMIHHLIRLATLRTTMDDT